MSLLQIVCDNCGAKYRLPETFSGAQAKCKACGSVIDVQRQRDAASAPAAPTPASAPAKAASGPATSKPVESQPAAKPEPKPERKSEPAAPKARESRAERTPRAAAPAAKSDEKPATVRSSRRQEAAASGSDDKPARAGRSREPREAPAKKSQMPMLIGAGIGVIALAVVGFVVFGGGGEPANANSNTENTATAPKPEAAKPAPTPEQPKTDPAKVETPKPADPKAATTPANAGTPANEPAKPAAKPAPKTRDPIGWKNADVISVDQVFVPSKELQPLPFPEAIPAAEQAEATEMALAVKNGGRAGNQARNALPGKGLAGCIAIVNVLRELNYLDSFDCMTGYSLNKLLEEMTGGLNADFDAPNEAGEIEPRQASFYGKTVMVWQAGLKKYQTPKEFDEARAERLKKNEGK